MRVRAVAIASDLTNVIGTVELAAEPRGLCVTYLDAAQVSRGQVPIPFVPGSQRSFGWERVRDARTLGHSLFLALDAHPNPVQTLRLVRFASGDELTLKELRIRRIVLRLFAVAAIAIGTLLSFFAVPRLSPGQGPLLTLAVAVVVVLVALLLSIAADRHLVTGGQAAGIVRELFVAELMGMLPNVPREPAPPRPWLRLSVPSFDGIIPRTTLAISLTLIAGLLGLVVLVRWTLGGNHDRPLPRSARAQRERAIQTGDATHPASLSPPVPPSRDTSPKGATAATSSATTPASSAAVADLPIQIPNACTCTRADSLLWARPPLVVSPLVLSSRRFPHKNHEDVELELAIVNNGERQASRIGLLVQFLEADRSETARLSTTETRAVYHEGPLLPGHAIKWHLEERGTAFEISSPNSEGKTLDQRVGPRGEGAAPASAFLELLDANHRPVRLHAAMMLAYLGDDRAREAISRLNEGGYDGESLTLRRLLDATAEQIVCDHRLSGTGPARSLTACVMNRSPLAQPNLALVLRILDRELSESDPNGSGAQVTEELSLPVPVSLGPKSGQRFTFDIPWSNLPAIPPALELAVAPKAPL